MASTGESSTRIYRIMIMIITFSLLYWVLVEKVLSFYSEVEKVAEQKSKDDFATSVSHIRNQWMQTKRLEVLIKLVGQAELSSAGELKVLVNENGFAIKILSESHSQCDGLFKRLQSIALSEINSVEIVEKGQVIGCRYDKKSKMLFKYMFLNGEVST